MIAEGKWREMQDSKQKSRFEREKFLSFYRECLISCQIVERVEDFTQWTCAMPADIITLAQWNSSENSFYAMLCIADNISISFVSFELLNISLLYADDRCHDTFLCSKLPKMKQKCESLSWARNADAHIDWRRFSLQSQFTSLMSFQFSSWVFYLLKTFAELSSKNIFHDACVSAWLVRV